MSCSPLEPVPILRLPRRSAGVPTPARRARRHDMQRLRGQHDGCPTRWLIQFGDIRAMQVEDCRISTNPPADGATVVPGRPPDRGVRTAQEDMGHIPVRCHDWVCRHRRQQGRFLYTVQRCPGRPPEGHPDQQRRACADVCPVDCISGKQGSRAIPRPARRWGQLRQFAGQHIPPPLAVVGGQEFRACGQRFGAHTADGGNPSAK